MTYAVSSEAGEIYHQHSFIKPEIILCTVATVYAGIVTDIVMRANMLSLGGKGALCGNVRIIQGQNYLSEHAIAVRANADNDTGFLLYLLDFMKLGQYSDQGAQPGLAVNKLLRLKCTVPDKKTQSNIASFLLRLDSQISNQEKMLSVLAYQREAFLQQLFI